MTDEELRLTDRYKVELENAIYYYRPRNDRETELIELLILEKLKQENKVERENEELKEELKVCQSVASEIVNKMKNCGNCKYYYCSNDTKGKCNLRNPKENKCVVNICGMWELAE